MHPYPHTYAASLSCTAEGPIITSAPGLPDLDIAPPAEFDGPGNKWSPETLLAAALSDCFALTFRVISRASKLAWDSLDCQTQGILELSNGKICFTEFTLTANLRIPPGTSESAAMRLLEKAEKNCLISNSLSTPVALQAHVHILDEVIQ